MSLQQAINKICADMKKAENQADVEDYAVRPVLLALGWPDQLGIIRRQYRPDKDSKVDFALCHPETNKPLVFIETKNSTEKLEKHEDQLLKYAFEKGAKLAILTNGRTWKFYYPSGKGTSSERCFYDLNLCEDGLEKGVFRLERYLRYEEIVNGQAFSVIREDCNEAYIHRKIVDAWEETVNDPSLIDSLIETMEKKLKKMDPSPSRENILLFLKRLSVPPLDTSPSQGTTTSSVLSVTGFILYGRHYYAQSGIAILVGVLNELIKLNSSFAERFVKSDFNFRKNRYKYFSRNRNDLQNPKPVRQLDSGWWINRNLNIRKIDRIIQEACRVAEVKYGSDLIVSLPPGKNKIKAFPKELPPPTLHSSPPPASIETRSHSLGPTPLYYDTTQLDRGFILFGEKYSIKRANRILVGVFNELAKINLSFLERFARSDFNRYKDRYNYLSKNPDTLRYPDRVKRLDSDWSINSNLTIKMVDDIIQEACKICKLKYLSNLSVHWRVKIAERKYDLIVHFPSERKKRSSSKKKSSTAR